MKLTEDDPDLALRGYIIGATKLPPNDPRIRNLGPQSLAYMAHWLHKHETEWWDRIIKLLGLHWKKEDIVQALSDKKGKPDDGIFLPLSFVIQPQMPEVLRKVLGTQTSSIGDGSYWPTKDEEVVDLAEVDRETFKQILSSAGSIANLGGVKK